MRLDILIGAHDTLLVEGHHLRLPLTNLIPTPKHRATCNAEALSIAGTRGAPRVNAAQKMSVEGGINI